MSNSDKSFWSTPQGWAALGLIGAVSYFLLVEHGEHLFNWLPFAILLLCPIMHLFMHGGHNDAHGDEHHHQQDKHQYHAPNDDDNNVKKQSAIVENKIDSSNRNKAGDR